ncbi:hypothetical protein BH09BAC3_BH09BAC3_01530 [soil metagenome]
MKKIINYLFLPVCIGIILSIQSCKSDNDIQPAPSVVLSVETAQNLPGGKVSTTATVNAPNGAKTLTVFVSGVEDKSYELAGAKTATQLYEYTIPATAVVGSIITINFQVTDSKNFPSTLASLRATVGNPIVELTGTLSGTNLALKKGTQYLIKGQAFVASGATLTVEPGTIVKGDKGTKGVLVIQPGGKIMAVGTATEPIVFTSSKNIGERDRGDWGGIVLLGNAYVNQSAKPAIEGITPSQTYGTVDAAQASATVGSNTEDSGKLKYVRIEYAGIELTPNNETNGLTLGGVGSGTEIDFVQVSYGGDDAFEWFGGTVNAKHLVTLSTWDDDFDTDFGWRGNVQWGLAVRNAFSADQSGSTGFESDSQGNSNPIGTICTSTAGQTVGCTQGVFSNITVLGPREYNAGLTGSFSTGGARAISANYTRGLHIRRRSAISIFNSFLSGFSGAGTTSIPALTMDDQGTIDNFNAGVGVFANNVMMFADAGGTTEFGTNVAGAAPTVTAFWNTNNLFAKPVAGAFWSATPGTPAGSIDPYAAYGVSAATFFGSNNPASYPSNPNFALGGTGSLGSQTPSLLFADAKLQSFFDKSLTYKGAFGATDWTDGWSEFQPVSKAY